MPDYASVEDVEKRWPEGTIDTANTPYIETLLNDAEEKLRSPSRVPDLDTRVTQGTLSLDAVKMVVVGMVLRVLRSPGVYTNQTAGPFGMSGINMRLASGVLEVTDEDLADLGINSSHKSYTISLRPPEWGF